MVMVVRNIVFLLVKSPSNQVEGEGMSVAVKLGSYKHVYNKLLVTANEFKSLVGFESFMVTQSWLYSEHNPTFNDQTFCSLINCNKTQLFF